MMVDGLHRVTAITADIDTNLEFYGRLLRLRLVWQGVNADDPEMRHIAYGDEGGRPGIVTFFDIPGVVSGRPGTGMVHRLLSGWPVRRRSTSGSVASLVLAFRATGARIAWRSRTRRALGWSW
jgi:catechol 2,3-dioxygenase-like lactoylglutathione lyase family enzyme